MKDVRLVNFLILILTISSLTGCYWPRYGEHRSGGEQRSEGNHHTDEGRR